MKVMIKKKLSDFMIDESGAMSKENLLKVGIGTLAALGMFSSFTVPTASGACYRIVPSHLSYNHANGPNPKCPCPELRANILGPSFHVNINGAVAVEE